MKRTSQAIWKGSGLEGSGVLNTPASGLMNQVPYSFKARFQSEDGKMGTNPEELIAAAHAGCYSMALSFALGRAGFTADEISTDATLTLENEGGWVAKGMHLTLVAKVPGITAEQFAEIAEAAKSGCPVSKMLSIPVTLTATLG